MKIISRAIVSVAFTLILAWALNKRWGQIPPIAKILNPVTGFWQNADPAGPPDRIAIRTAGITGPITVAYDKGMIPHVFAGNDDDLYFAQGYVTARDRLWQMEFQSRVAVGRISEILGPKGINHDENARFMGMQDAAQNAIQALFADPVMKKVIEAYTAGVNAYIHQLSPAAYPLEYKVLDLQPEEWTPFKCGAMFKLMALTLSGGSDEFEMSNTRRKLGYPLINDLFPDRSPVDDPVIPTGTKWAFPSLNRLRQPAPTDFIPDPTGKLYNHPKEEGVGSNGWVVDSTRSADRSPLLANDPHLSLTLPSFWYQIQLVSPDVNVYGVSIPGIPCVIIGYNQQCTWGMTNAYVDVTDWYKLKFRDEKRKEYWYNDHWTAIKTKIEKIVVRNGRTIMDTIPYTTQGPLVLKNSRAEKKQQTHPGELEGFALRWIAREGSTELKTFYLLNRSRNEEDFRNALQYYTCPAQNFIFASADNHIAIATGGRIPLRYKDQGRFIQDGTDSLHDWHEYIPAAQNPFAKDPQQGFLGAANQLITDSTYPYYLGSAFGPSYRARRINDQLKNMHHATPDSFRLLQNDTYSILASEVLPDLLTSLRHAPGAPYEHAYKEISQWNYRYDTRSVGATIFNTWWDLFYRSIWQDEFGDKTRELKWPGTERTVRLFLQQKDADWFDDKNTPVKETCTDLVNQSFIRAVDSLAGKYGAQGRQWEWGSVRLSRISHVSGAAFSIGPFAAGGSPNTVDAMSGGFGPSWRMVVRPGPHGKGYGIFPGGESGNPGSPYYDNFFSTWKEGQLNELLFMNTAGEFPGSIRSTLTINK